jgi:hypothetical protein
MALPFKFGPEACLAIRAEYDAGGSGADLGRKYNVTHHTILAAVRRAGGTVRRPSCYGIAVGEASRARATRVCTVCQRELPLSSFNRRRMSAHQRQPRCRECSTAYFAGLRARRKARSDIATPPTLKCTVCEIEKPSSQFNRCAVSFTGRTPDCKACTHERQTHAYRADPERFSTRLKNWRARLRDEVFAAYGGRCDCCGESNFGFLTIDHVHGDGAAHRRSLGVGRRAPSSVVYSELKRRGFPRGPYRVLCCNCNATRGIVGYCPHEGLTEEEKRSRRRPCRAKSVRQQRKIWVDRERSDRLKAEVLEAYGGACFCCGMTGPEFLTIDHVEPLNRCHRRKAGLPAEPTGAKLYKRLKDLGFPQGGYRLLCWNCNCGRSRHGRNGRCPHEDALPPP